MMIDCPIFEFPKHPSNSSNQENEMALVNRGRRKGKILYTWFLLLVFLFDFRLLHLLIWAHHHQMCWRISCILYQSLVSHWIYVYLSISIHSPLSHFLGSLFPRVVEGKLMPHTHALVFLQVGWLFAPFWAWVWVIWQISPLQPIRSPCLLKTALKAPLVSAAVWVLSTTRSPQSTRKFFETLNSLKCLVFFFLIFKKLIAWSLFSYTFYYFLGNFDVVTNLQTPVSYVPRSSNRNPLPVEVHLKRWNYIMSPLWVVSE